MRRTWRYGRSSNGVYAVEAAEEGASRHFAYSLYQYDVSAGKAVLAGQADDALHVAQGPGPVRARHGPARGGVVHQLR